MLLKDNKSKNHPEEVLEAVLSLEGNADFETIMEYIATSKVNCAHQACYNPDKELSGRYSGGYIALIEFQGLVGGAKKELESIRTKSKPEDKKTFA